MSLLEHDVAELANDSGDHETRLRVLERLELRLLAYAGIGGGFGAALAGIAVHFVDRGHL